MVEIDTELSENDHSMEGEPEHSDLAQLAKDSLGRYLREQLERAEERERKVLETSSRSHG